MMENIENKETNTGTSTKTAVEEKKEQKYEGDLKS